jgi:hypothetical protein
MILELSSSRNRIGNSRIAIPVWAILLFCDSDNAKIAILELSMSQNRIGNYRIAIPVWAILLFCDIGNSKIAIFRIEYQFQNFEWHSSAE